MHHLWVSKLWKQQMGQQKNKRQTPRCKKHVDWTPSGVQLWAVEKFVDHCEISGGQTEYLVKMGAREKPQGSGCLGTVSNLPSQIVSTQSTTFDNNNSFTNFQSMHCAEYPLRFIATL
ncbi:hypothetical protein BT96DRAFT_943527 [Gymnopus androsaceus JB14]|uniref:Uncharacterized protein n=1 Tax=Gymnopus androsaceus JB14 TaxID=1447944 RepID=A0A6A4H837_9AGAR|nr:hypothetical protein BT96DRAFT_943527 [Gymnopus androsaceus JB14]